MRIGDYVTSFQSRFPFLDPSVLPWEIISRLPSVLERLAATLSASSFRNAGGVWVHSGATVEPGAVLKPPAVISDGCFIASTAYVRGGVFLDRGVVVGPCCELKATVIMTDSTVAHLNFVADSIIGADVNVEAGVIIANHYNERRAKEIRIHIGGQQIQLGVTKFGALIGDGCRLGANAVLSPGTVLEPNTVVGRLALVNQTLG